MLIFHGIVPGVTLVILLVTCYQITTAGKKFSLALLTVKIVHVLNPDRVHLFVINKVTVARVNPWSAFYLVRATYHDCFMMIPVFLESLLH